MNATTESILKDPTNYPIPETKEEKLKILHDLASQVLDGEPKLPAGVSDLPGKGVDPAMTYILRFESPYIVLAAHLLHKRFRVILSENQKWISWFFGRTSEGTQKTDAEVCDIYNKNEAAAKQLSVEFGLGIKSLESS
jgi:hypothetical protein